MFEWLKNIFNPAQPNQDNVVDQQMPDDDAEELDRYAKGSPGEDSPYEGSHDGDGDGGD